MADDTTTPTTVQELRDDAALFGERAARGNGDFSLSPQERAMVLATRRAGDLTGTPPTAYLPARTYQEKVLRAWDAYSSDPLFHYLIDRASAFVATESKFEVAPPPSAGESELERVKREQYDVRAEREEAFWNMWAERLNEDVANTLPSLDEITKWAAKHMQLSGMFVPTWEYGTMKLGKQTLLVPTRFACLPASAVVLVRQEDLFVDERILFVSPKMAAAMQGGRMRIPILDKMREGEPRQANPFVLEPNKGSVIEVPPMGSAQRAGDVEGFALKFNWTPGDLALVGRPGQFGAVGQAVYPMVPFISLLPQFTTRQKLFAADLSILDGIINYIMLWSIGDEKNPPLSQARLPDGTVNRKSTIEIVREAIQAGRVGDAFEMFVPYWVKLDVIMPDVKALLDNNKYIQSTQEIMQAFGIFQPRAASRGNQLERINITNFEEYLKDLRTHVALFYRKLVRRVIELNGDKLKYVPRWSSMPFNTKSEQFVAQLFKLGSTGQASYETMQRYLGLDSDVERYRIARELATDVDDVYNAHVPVSYVQRTVLPPDVGGQNPPVEPMVPPAPPAPPAPPGQPPLGGPGGPTVETRIPPTKQQGRPPDDGVAPKK